MRLRDKTNRNWKQKRSQLSSRSITEFDTYPVGQVHAPNTKDNGEKSTKKNWANPEPFRRCMPQFPARGNITKSDEFAELPGKNDNEENRRKDESE